MPSSASIPVTLRTLFKKKMWGGDGFDPPGSCRLNWNGNVTFLCDAVIIGETLIQVVQVPLAIQFAKTRAAFDKLSQFHLIDDEGSRVYQIGSCGVAAKDDVMMRRVCDNEAGLW